MDNSIQMALADNRGLRIQDQHDPLLAAELDHYLSEDERKLLLSEYDFEWRDLMDNLREQMNNLESDPDLDRGWKEFR